MRGGTRRLEVEDEILHSTKLSESWEKGNTQPPSGGATRSPTAYPFPVSFFFRYMARRVQLGNTFIPGTNSGSKTRAISQRSPQIKKKATVAKASTTSHAGGKATSSASAARPTARLAISLKAGDFPKPVQSGPAPRGAALWALEELAELAELAPDAPLCAGSPPSGPRTSTSISTGAPGFFSASVFFGGESGNIFKK